MHRFGLARCAGLAMAALIVAATALPILAKAAEIKRTEGDTLESPNLKEPVQKTRCKFFCEKVADTYWGAKEVTLSARYDPHKSPEDVGFSTATPSGTMQVMINNPALDGFFIPGQEYYLDVTAVPTPPPNAA